MGIARRIAELYEVKMNAALDRATDPREMLDYSYGQLQDLLTGVRRAVTEIAASGNRAERQVSGLQRAADRLGGQAEQAVTAGREDLARQALARRTAILAQVADLRDQQATLRSEQEKLAAAGRRLEAKIEAFRIQKETIKAAYTAARAHADIAEAFAGISGEMGDADMATRRAEDQAAELGARASALDSLLSTGGLGDVISAVDDGLQAQLDEISTRAAVDEELARIKERLAAEAAQPGADSAEGCPAGHSKAAPHGGGAPSG
jgi:phage shock protein A